MRISFFVVALLLTTSGACAQLSTSDGEGTCTQIGCQDGLTIMVTPTSAWPAGEYQFTIEADGVTTTCTGTLPLPACGTPGISCDGAGVLISESGCALPAAEHGFGDIMFESTPASVSIEVMRGDQQVGAQSWTPTYATLQPNGPDCEPTCDSASVELALTL